MYDITGTTGHIGSCIAEALLKEMNHVRVVGPSTERLKTLAARGAEPFVASLGRQHDANVIRNIRRFIRYSVPDITLATYQSTRRAYETHGQGCNRYGRRHRHRRSHC